MKQNNGHLRNKPKDMSKSDGKRSYEYAGNKDEDFDEAWSKFKANTKKAFMGKYAKGGVIYKHKHIPTMTFEITGETENGYKGIQKDKKSLSRLERTKGKSASYSSSELKDLFNKETFAKGGGLELVHVYDDDGSLFGTGSIEKVVGKKTYVRFDGETVKAFDSNKVKAIMARGGDISVYGTKDKVKEMYLDYLNNFLSVEKFAEHYGMSEEKANRIIEIGREHANEDGYFAKGGQTYAEGGKVNSSKRGGYFKDGEEFKGWNHKAKEVWNGWSADQRKHFMHDHQILRGNQSDFNRVSLYKFDELYSPEVTNQFSFRGDVQDSIIDHIRMGKYEKGGSTYAEGGEIDSWSEEMVNKIYSYSLDEMPTEQAKKQRAKNLSVSEKRKWLKKEEDKFRKSFAKGGSTYASGGEIERLIKDGNLIFSKTKKEHSDIYGIDSNNPLFIQHLCIDTNNREKGLGKKVIDHIEDYAIRNNHDLIFGHISIKSKYGKKDICDAEKVKSWMVDKGYNIAPDTNDFYKKLSKRSSTYAQGGEIKVGDKVKMFKDEPFLIIKKVNEFADKGNTYSLASEDGKIKRNNISHTKIISTYAEGGSMGKGKNEAHVQINDYPYTATIRDLKSFAEHLGSKTEKFTLGVFGKITYISDDADKEWVKELKRLISSKQIELERVKKVSDKMDLDEAKRREKRNAPRRITKVEDAEAVGYKEYKDYYRVGEGSIAINQERDEDGNEINEYYILDTRNGYSTDKMYTLTEARKELRKYLNEERVLILSETRFRENVDEMEVMFAKKRYKEDYAEGGETKGKKKFVFSNIKGEVVSDLTLSKQESIAKETSDSLGKGFSVDKDSVGEGHFNLYLDLGNNDKYADLSGGGGEFVIMKDGRVINQGRSGLPIAYNWKTKKSYAEGGNVKSEDYWHLKTQLQKNESILEGGFHSTQRAEEVHGEIQRLKNELKKYEDFGSTYAEGGEIGYEDKVIKELEELGYFEYNAKELYRKHRDTIDLSAKSSPKAMARALANTEGHTYAEGGEINTKVDTLKKGDTISIEFGSSFSKDNKVTLKVRSRNKVRKGTVDKITFENADSPSTVRYYAYERGDGVWRFAKGDSAISNINITDSYAKGGEVMFTDLSDNTQSRKEWESRKSKHTNQNSFGSFSHKINNRTVGSYYLYRLSNYDENYYSHIPLKDGEILARVETDNMVGGEMPLVKINILNGRVYFMSEENDLNSDEDDKNPKFDRASADVLYLSLDNQIKTYEKFRKKQKEDGSSYAKGGMIYSNYFSGMLSFLNY